MTARERHEERLSTLADAMEYAQSVVAKMPHGTLAERKARAEKYVAIMDEWHKARIRWKIVQP